ncbi:MAG: YkgJ family cysteine cluster protein [Rhodocyclaceae bacterium]|jgi:hypothetical protein|nr:YkgJ family cysteine cluster protein [Rhodocyclaceae bacterium]
MFFTLSQTDTVAAAPLPDSTCQSCGACCVSYRVTLPRVELDSAPGGWVPVALTEPYTATTACMREHPDAPGRCIALEGNVGVAVRCAIYPQRPSACSEFAPLSALGRGDDACDAARRRRGLPPLGGI